MHYNDRKSLHQVIFRWRRGEGCNVENRPRDRLYKKVIAYEKSQKTFISLRNRSHERSVAYSIRT